MKRLPSPPLPLQEEDLAAFVWSEPLLLDQPLLQGALEELEALPPLGLVPDPATLPSMPAACLEQPFAKLEIGTRWGAGPGQGCPCGAGAGVCGELCVYVTMCKRQKQSPLQHYQCCV